MHKSETEMKRVVQFVKYEWDLLSWAASDMPRKSATDEWRAGTGSYEKREDVPIEILLLHARTLRDFFSRRRTDLRKYEQTDILAEDFFDNPGEWTTPTLGYLSQLPNQERLNRALAHLSYDRTGYESTDKDWDFKAITEELQDAWQDFLAALTPDRRKWFT